MSADPAAAANVLGAVALAVPADPAGDSGRRTVRFGCGGAVGAYHVLDHPTVDQLCQVLGLTHSGGVRLVDRLAGAGLVERGPGADRRSRSVRLTAAGRRAAHRMSGQRIAYLTSLLARLSPPKPAHCTTCSGA